MAGLESTISAAEVAPISGIQFKLPSVANYVTSRTELYYVPSGNDFAPNGVRTLRINCSGNGFADLSTAVLEFDLKNNSTTNALMPLSAHGGSFFADLRVFLG